MEETFAAPEDTLCLPLPAVFPVTFLVYFRRGWRRVPDKAAMLRTVDAWLERCGDPARADIREFLAKGMLRVKAGGRGDVSCPPWEALQWCRPGKMEERRFRGASHLVAVGTQDWLGAPRVGIWMAAAAARALADALGGVIIDGVVPRLIPCASHREPVPSDFRIYVADHAVMPVSTSGTGLAWVTTKGLGRFGLPDLQVEHVPSAVVQVGAIEALVLGVAQWLLETCMAQAGHPAGESVEIRLPR